MKNNNKIICVILAGGKGSRLDGKGKYNQLLNNKTLLENVYDNIKNQFIKVVVNFNKIKEIRNIKLEIIYDIYKKDIGPLAGIHSALNFAEKNFGEEGYVCTVPVDTPFLPNDLAFRLYNNIKKNKAEVVIAKSNNRHHPTIALWRNNLKKKLEVFINNDLRKIDYFTNELNKSYENWKFKKLDPFFNINRYEDLKVANNMIKNK